MNTIKCHRCGFVSLNASTCKQCGTTRSTPQRKLQLKVFIRLAVYGTIAITVLAVYLTAVRPTMQKAIAIEKAEVDRAARLPKRNDVIKMIESQLGTAGETQPGSGKGYGPCGAIISYDFQTLIPGDETSYSDGRTTIHAYYTRATFTKTARYADGYESTERYGDVSFGAEKNGKGQWEVVFGGTMENQELQYAYRRNRQEETNMSYAANAKADELGNTPRSETPCR
jgi:hypothetical protein